MQHFWKDRFRIMSREFLLKQGEREKSIDVLMELHEDVLSDLEREGIVKIGRGRKLKVFPMNFNN